MGGIEERQVHFSHMGSAVAECHSLTNSTHIRMNLIQTVCVQCFLQHLTSFILLSLPTSALTENPINQLTI